MHSRALFVIALLLAAFAGQPALAAKRVALVIGNSAYASHGTLKNPANDAISVADLLRRARFDVVESKRDLKNAEMRRALRDFSAKARDADYAVVYFAGHGIEVDGTNYLIPIDAVLDQDSDAYDEAVALDRVLQAIEPAKKLRLVILDACRDNPFARTMKRSFSGRTSSRGLAGVEPGRSNTLIAFAAKGGSIADDGPGANSPYTTALLKYLALPGLDLRKAFGHVRDEVVRLTDNKQEPFLYGSLGGADVALMPSAHSQVAQASFVPQAAAQANTTTPLSPHGEARRDYELALQLGTRQAWKSYLAQYPEGFFADLAREQLERLAGQDRLAADKAATESAEADAKAIRERAITEARAIIERAEAGARVAEDARKAAEDEAERLRRLIAKMESGGVASRPEFAKPKPVRDQVVCDFQGCRPVKPGCHVASRMTEGGVNGWAREVCQ